MFSSFAVSHGHQSIFIIKISRMLWRLKHKRGLYAMNERDRTCTKPPAQTQGMHVVSVKHWNIKTHKLYRKINHWRITKSKRFNCFTCFETDWNVKKIGCPNVSAVSKCFKTKWNKTLEKVKIPGPISGVSKHWNNGLYREITETDWNMKKID